MAFSYGFFNAKNLDRTYTAENFNDYLGSIICDGIQDNFEQCFEGIIGYIIYDIDNSMEICYNT